MTAKKAKSAPVVLPVGGGKGGIGKSVLAANLCLALARLGHTVTVIDADLGGSDLHNFLGLADDLPGLGEVLTSRDMKLAQVVHPAMERGFHFVPGDAMVAATANPSFQKKRKLLVAIKKLPGQFVFMDLGAGTAITVMDFFLTNPVSLVVMLPERPAALNAFNFLKNAIFRALGRIFRRNAKTKKVLEDFRGRSRGPGTMKMGDLIQAMEEAQPGEGPRARRAVERWRPKLVLNRVRRVEDFIYARQLAGWAAEDLGMLVEVLGFVPEDDVVGRAAGENRPALDMDPRSPFGRAVALLALKISPWAEKGPAWAAHKDFTDSFERAATEFAALFPPPGTQVPTREELLRRLRELQTSIDG